MAPRREAPARPARSGSAGRPPQRLSSIDDVSVGGLVGEPWDRVALVDATGVPVADPSGERLLELGPLLVGERDRVVVAALQRLQRALVDVGGDAFAGDRRRRPEARLDLVEPA